jgi:hypothetical protein
MRTFIIALVTAVLTAALSVGLTYQHMQTREDRVKVDAFNEGVMDGACSHGQDAFGHICK